MKKLAVLVLSVLAAPALMAQGEFIFEDFVSPDTSASDGNAFVGGTFAVDIFWGPQGSLAGSLTNQLGAPASYFGALGGSPGTDGAGLFSAGTVAVLGQPGGVTITAQLRAVSPAGYFIQSGNALFDIELAEGATPRNTIPSQTLVFAVPEPTSFALAGLGAAALLIFRRRN